MAKKTCTKCGKTFEAFNPKFDICPKCNKVKNNPSTGGNVMQNQHQRGFQKDYRSGGQRGGNPRNNASQSLPQHLKLDTLYSETGSILPGVYSDISLQIAGIFNNANITTSAIRPFFETVRAAYDNYRVDNSEKNAESVMESLNRLLPFVNYKGNNKNSSIELCFSDFMQHYIRLVSKDTNNLKGFKELFMSVVGYMKENRR